MIIAFTVTGLALLAAYWVCWQLLRQNGRMLLRLEELEKLLDEVDLGESEKGVGLPIDSPAPGFELPDLAGETHTLAHHRGQQLLLIFFNPDCGFCRDMAPKLAAFPYHPFPPIAGDSHRPGEGYPQPLIITTGDAEKNRQLFGEHKIGCPVLLQMDGEVASAYQTTGTPSGYLISAEGRIASDLALGAEALLTLMERKNEHHEAALNSRVEGELSGNCQALANRFRKRSLARSKIKRDGLKAGTPAPNFSLPRLDGREELSLAELRGHRVLLVFSSPTCGPCLELAPQLEKFHRAHLEIKVVMISKGDPKQNRTKVKEHGLTIPIVLQQGWEISRRYAMFATPIAYLIDESGMIVHEVAVGIDGIQRMLGHYEKSPADMRAKAFIA